MNMLSAISGESLIQSVFYLIIIGLVFWLFWWLISYVGLPEPFAKVARVILAVIAVMILVNFLLGLVGKPFIKW